MPQRYVVNKPVPGAGPRGPGDPGPGPMGFGGGMEKLANSGLRFAFGSLVGPEGEDPNMKAVGVPQTSVKYLDEAAMEEYIGIVIDRMKLYASLGFDAAMVPTDVLTSFMSEKSNRRTDEYGGSLENRLRFSHRFFKAIRRTLGNNFLLYCGAPIGGRHGPMGGGLTDEGNIVSFYVLNTENVYSGMGYMTRKDLLDQAGLDIPETYDDWYEMLTAYKNMGVEIPCYNLGDMGGLLFGGWGLEYNWIDFMNNPYFQIDGQAQFSPFAENFKPMLETFHKWYSEGLVMEDFYSMHDMSDTQAKEYNGVTATWVCYANAVNVFKNNTTIEGAEAVPIPNPVQNKGEHIHIATSDSLVGNDCGAISTQCEYPELATQWLDFWYSPKGSELLNYGVEGVSFEYNASGEPEFTDVVLNNEYGLTTEAIQALYLGYNFAGLFDPTVMLATYDQGQLTAMDVWTSNIDSDWNYPMGASLTAQESEEYNGYYSDISTYLSTEVVGFVTGARDLGTFDDFIDTLKSMGADRCLEIRQASLDRYYSKALN